jgi:RNA polymerase sigma-70 factor (TIGR02960 family)
VSRLTTNGEGRGAMTQMALTQAQAGDGEAFEEITAPYRRELLVHCYRILGSLQDAEDVLQETLLSAWRSIDRFDGRSLRAWLYRIATNRCLNYLRDGSRRPRSTGGLPTPLPGRPSHGEDPPWLEPYPDLWIDDVTPGPEARYETRESIALSFVSALQRLPANQRAVLVLRDVLGFSATEVAVILGTTSASVNSALLRARAGFPPSGGRDTLPLPRSAPEIALVDRFVNAFESSDIDEIVALLTDDARVAMPPEPWEYHGPQAIGAFFESLSIWGRPRKLVATRANGQPAFGYYVWDPASAAFLASGILVLELGADGIAAVTRFGDTGLLSRFGLPASLQP